MLRTSCSFCTILASSRADIAARRPAPWGLAFARIANVAFETMNFLGIESGADREQAATKRCKAPNKFDLSIGTLQRRHRYRADNEF